MVEYVQLNDGLPQNCQSYLSINSINFANVGNIVHQNFVSEITRNAEKEKEVIGV